MSSLTAVGVRLVGSVLQVLVTVLVARWGSAAVLGQFVAFVAITNIVMSIGGGFPNLLLRAASIDTQGDQRTGWLWRDTLGVTALGGLVACIAAILDGEFIALLAVGTVALLLQRASTSPVKAASRAGLGVVLDTAVWPGLVTVQVVLWHILGWQLNLGVLAWGCIAGLLLSALIGVVVCWRLPSSVRAAWRNSSPPTRAHYVEVAVVTVGTAARAVSANAPLALAPLFLSDSGTGRLGLALRLAGFATTILVALAAHFSPLFARANSRPELRAHRRNAQVAGTVLYLPVLLAALAMPLEWLRFLGPDFVDAKRLVAVLAAGYLITAATGLNSQLLVMRGRMRDYTRQGVYGAALTVFGVVVGARLGGELGLCVGLSASLLTTAIWTHVVAARTVRAMPHVDPVARPDPFTRTAVEDN